MVEEIQHNLNLAVSFIVQTAKDHGAVIESVGPSEVAMKWTAHSHSHNRLKAVTTALALLHYEGPLLKVCRFSPRVAVGCGMTVSGLVTTPHHLFYVLFGGEVELVRRLVRTDYVEAPVLITGSVRESVQYNFRCHPRLVEDSAIIWEPLRECEQASDEWMYSIRPEADEVDVEALAAPFKAASRKDWEKVPSLVLHLQEQYTGKMGQHDIMALKHLQVQVEAQEQASHPAIAEECHATASDDTFCPCV